MQTKKRDWKEIHSILVNHGVYELYHVTRKENLVSILGCEGLFSWGYCEAHGITIACPGGNWLSRKLDQRRGLEDYVRLSFALVPPMYYAPERLANTVILAVNVEVAYWATTLFSNMNAADRYAEIGTDVASLRSVHFDIVLATDDRSYYWEEKWKKYRQAEVLVKTHVPLSMIRVVE